MRLLFVLLFAALYSLAEVVLAAVVVMQFVVILVTGRRNARLLQLGKSLSLYAYQVWMFVTFNSNTKPYPFAEWPDGAPADADRNEDIPLPSPSEPRAPHP